MTRLASLGEPLTTHSREVIVDYPDREEETLILERMANTRQAPVAREVVSLAQVQSQIDVLNEDFLALAGSNGADGTDIQIQFYLAEVDPNGNATNGVTYSNNTSWYNDSGSYWNSLAWDTNRYLNIYTNSAGGFLGYVPDLPQGGIAGSNSARNNPQPQLLFR